MGWVMLVSPIRVITGGVFILDLDGPGDWNRRVPFAVCISVSDLIDSGTR